MASFAIVLRLVVCLSVLYRGIDFVATTAAAVPAQETCTVSTVTEGAPAVMTFKLRSGIDTASKTFFAHLRRNDSKLTDIVTCDGLKVACDVKDGHPMFQVDNIKENTLTVRISRMSRELEDTYMLQVYYNGATEPVSSCTLNLTYAQMIATISTDVETEDQNGNYGWIAGLIIGVILVIAVILLVFFWERVKPELQKCIGRQALEQNEPHFHFHTDAANSGNPNGQEKAGPGAENKPLLSDGSTSSGNHARLPPVPHRKHDEPDTPRSDDKEQQSSVGGNIPHLPPPKLPPPPQPVKTSPPLDRKHDEPGTPRSDDMEQQSSVGGNIPHLPPPDLPPPPKSVKTSPPLDRKRHEPDTPRSDDKEQQSSVSGNIPHLPPPHLPPPHLPPPHLPPPPKPVKTSPPLDRPATRREHNNGHEGMRWFVGKLSNQEVDKLFKFGKPRAGNFLITQDKTDPSSFVLAVCWKGQEKVNRFYIDQNDGGFTLNSTKEQFETLCELVNCYKTNPMRVGKKDLGKLSKPCEEDPIKYAWYFGSLNADEVENVLLNKHTDEGSFLVTENVNNEDNYSLSVKFGGKPVPFTIVPQDDGFKISHLKRSFRTLQDFVEHYRTHDLDGRGKLRKPLEIIPEELTTKEKQILEKPGFFFFKDSRIPSRRVLAVHAYGEVKQFIIIKSKDGCGLADHGITHTSEDAMERYYKSKAVTLHGEEYGRLRTNCTHKLKEK